MSENFVTTAEAVKRLGVSPRTIHRAAAAAGINKIGMQFLFTEADLVALKSHIHGEAGNPNFVKGNQLWKLRE